MTNRRERYDSQIDTETRVYLVQYDDRNMNSFKSREFADRVLENLKEGTKGLPIKFIVMPKSIEISRL